MTSITGSGPEEVHAEEKRNKMATGSEHGLKRIVWKSKFIPSQESLMFILKIVGLRFRNVKALNALLILFTVVPLMFLHLE